MDPNRVLAQMRATAEAMQSDQCTWDMRAVLARDLVELVRALDGWLTRGGFPPEAWREGPDAAGEAPPELADIVDPHTGQPRRASVVEEIPAHWPVRPIRPVPGDLEVMTCGTCGRSWDDAVVTEMTPAPSGRCPFEPFHIY